MIGRTVRRSLRPIGQDNIAAPGRGAWAPDPFHCHFVLVLFPSMD